MDSCERGKCMAVARDLPVEIVHRIAKWLPREEGRPRYGDLVQMADVCVQWRRALSLDSSLFHTVHLDLRSEPSPGLFDMLERHERLEVLEIAGMSVQDAAKHPYLKERLVALMPRFTCLSMAACSNLDSKTLSAMLRRASGLKELRLIRCPFISVAVRLPNLRRLCLRDLFQCNYLEIQSPSLESLEVGQGTLTNSWEAKRTRVHSLLGLFGKTKANPILHPETLTKVDVALTEVPRFDESARGIYDAGDPMCRLLRSLTNVKHLDISCVRWRQQISTLDLSGLSHLVRLTAVGVRGVRRILLPADVAVVDLRGTVCSINRPPGKPLQLWVDLTDEPVTIDGTTAIVNRDLGALRL